MSAGRRMIGSFALRLAGGRRRGPRGAREGEPRRPQRCDGAVSPSLGARAHAGFSLRPGRHGRGGLGRRRRLRRGRDVGGRRRRRGAAAACRGLRRRCVEPAIATVAFNEPAPSMRRALRNSPARGVSDDVLLPRVRASTEREPGTCDVHVSPTRGARGCVQLGSARGRNAPAVGPRPFQIETLVEQQLFRTLREGKRTSFDPPPWNETFIFARRAVSKKGNFSEKVYPVHIRFFVTRAGGRGCDSGS